ncbi:MAG: trans-2-enoyl-CoA reductase family protein [Peptococcaceae bacterium]|jgi:enoyl-[acyl-carrier protein] reductase/trans-2-enoyl-CoA reductase (NAD+)|nr:trans-2-enoyl-CoA reductase family protein [Peptococcaceae bacterium]
MIIRPKYRGFICTTAHPAGCENNVRQQIDYVKSKGRIKGPARVLVVGSSTGYGLAARIAAAYGLGARTVGVFFERPGDAGKPGSAGWYNNRAFENFARGDGLFAKSLNGDAFSKEVKRDVVQWIQEEMPGGQIDLLIYSLASPRRADPETGQIYNSVIKPVGQVFRGKTVDFHKGTVSEVSIEPADEKEIGETVAVMGGADWRLWIEAALAAHVLADGFLTAAFSYLGPAQTHAIYKDGTIGMAKRDLERKSAEIRERLAPLGGNAFVSVNKAVVTQASAAIPVVPLYMSILYKVMKENHTHEGCVEQMYRLFHDRLYHPAGAAADDRGRIRMDDLELRPDAQLRVHEIWERVDSGNIAELADLEGYRKDFFNLFGFGRDDVDYEADVSPV